MAGIGKRAFVTACLLLVIFVMIDFRNEQDARRVKTRLGTAISDLRAVHAWWSQFTSDNDSIPLKNHAGQDGFSILTMAEHSGVKKGNPSLDRILEARDSGFLKFHCFQKNGMILGEWTVESRLLAVDIHGYVSSAPKAAKTGTE